MAQRLRAPAAMAKVSSSIPVCTVVPMTSPIINMKKRNIAEATLVSPCPGFVSVAVI